MHALAIAFISPGGGELLLVLLVLILLFGAKDAPRILRTIQEFIDKTQRTAASFRYKIMYGDLHDTSVSPPPYHTDEESSELGVGSSESEPANFEPETENSKPGPLN